MYPVTLSQILQRLPIITHGFVLLLVSIGPWLCPILLAACFLLTNLAFVSSQVRMAYSMIRCYWGVRTHWKTDWWSIYLQGIQSAPIEALDIRHSPHTLPHLIVIPSYKESLSTLRHTLAILASHPLAAHSYNVCLGMEQREQGSQQKGELLAKEFEGKFSDIVVTVHPADIPGEVPGKGSNTRWAARWMAEREAMKLPRSTQSGTSTPTNADVDAVITVMDADTAFAADYFLAVTVRYLLTSPEKRKVMMFVPPLIFDRNQSDVPAFTRVTDIMWSTAGISGIYPSSTIKVPTSAYSISLGLATHVGFWDAGPGAIGEDMHMFCKALFDTNGHLHVETIYSPASQCNVVGSNSHKGNGYIANFLGDCHARWAQAVRHMWGSLDTGYVAHRLLSGDFGVSDDREVEHRSQRLEMRRNVLDAAAKVRSTVQDLSIAEGQHSVRTSRKIVIPPTWIQSSRLRQDESPTPSSDEETVSSESSSREGILRSQRPPFTRASSSHYSYSSVDEECVPEVDSSTESTAFATFQFQGDPGAAPTSISSSSRLQKVAKFPFLVLAMRMYEAHIMLAHLFIFVNVFIVFPKLFSYLERELARQTEAWGRSSFGPSSFYTTTDDNGGRSIIFALMGGLWMEQDAIVSQTVSICNRLGAIGAASTLVTFLFHDLYHREAGKRWKGNNTPVINQGMMELGHRVHSSLGQPGNLSLGIPPHPQVTRRMPWCFFDYLAVPGGLAFGVAPLLYAQVCHIWTDRLAYRVSAKPQQGR